MRHVRICVMIKIVRDSMCDFMSDLLYGVSRNFIVGSWPEVYVGLDPTPHNFNWSYPPPHYHPPPPLPSHRGFIGVLYTTVLLPSHARFKGVLILSDSLLFFAQALYASYLCFVTAIPVYFDSHRQYTGIFLRTFLWLCLMRMILIQLW